MQRKRTGHQGDRAALLALFGIVAIFIAVVGRGWQTLLSSQGPKVSTAVGMAIALVATILAYAIASERVHHPLSKATAAAYFFVLFNISALGTVNAMFLMFQSSNIFREEIDKASTAIVTLRDVGAGSIDTSSYDRFKSDLNDKWRNLRAELENPQLCGQGPVAAQRIEELQSLLPHFRALAGGGRCDRVPALIASYEKQVKDLERESPIYLATKAKLELRSRLYEESNKLLESVNEVGRDLNGNFSLVDVKAKLFDIAERYSLLRQELGNRTEQAAKVPNKIEIKSISALGDIGQVLPFILSRLTEATTYIYLTLALVIDIAVIAAFSRVIRTGPSENQRKVATALRKI